VLRFYEVDDNLGLPSLAWLEDVERGDVVLLIDYFGFPCSAECASEARARGAWVVEDASQALLTQGVGRLADFVLYSPRKFLGVPDGGILAGQQSNTLSHVDLAPSPIAWWLNALSASEMRRDFDRSDTDTQWFKLFQLAESTRPVGAFSMSDLSRGLLQNSFDYHSIAEKRISNYNSLARELYNIALIPSLATGVVPLGFPVRVRNRTKVQDILYANKIYPAVHWQLGDAIPPLFSRSHRLSEEILTLPCDQRYDDDDMQRMVALTRYALTPASAESR
jgi:dTDP-4-amino-4,6-dideoxygalactose transaminase